MKNQVERFKSIALYHNSVGQLFWAIEQAIISPYESEWDMEYIVQCTKEVLHNHTRMQAAHIEE